MNESSKNQTETKQGLDIRQSVSQSEQNKATSSNDGQNVIFIENTPFMVGKMQDETWTIACGNKRIHETFKSAEEAIKKIKKDKVLWQLICLLCECVSDNLKNNQK